jgi:non-ribosomal peptide synthetase component F
MKNAAAAVIFRQNQAIMMATARHRFRAPPRLRSPRNSVASGALAYRRHPPQQRPSRDTRRRRDRIWLNHYPAGVPADIDADRYPSIPGLLDEIVRKYGGRPAFHNLGRTLSYAELDKLSRDFAAFLQGLPGMGKGERVAIMSPNLLQYPVALFGILRAGMTWSTSIRCTRRSELEHQLKDSGAKAIVIVENFAATLQQVWKKTRGAAS